MSLRASGASAGLRPCHSPPGGLGVTTSEEQIRTSSLCPRLMVTRVTAEARIRQRGGSSTCDPGLPGSGHACRKRRPGAYCHLARGLLRTFEVIRVFSGCDGFFKFVFSTISLYCSQGCVCVCVCACARLFLGFVVLLELLLDVSPMFWKPASLHLLKHSAPSPSPPLWTVIHSKHTPCSWVSLYIYIFSLLFSLWILPSL